MNTKILVDDSREHKTLYVGVLLKNEEIGWSYNKNDLDSDEDLVTMIPGNIVKVTEITETNYLGRIYEEEIIKFCLISLVDKKGHTEWEDSPNRTNYTSFYTYNDIITKFND
tara:strand:+ start:817 stop:1152 length:336 start_codon:yes stop_codon:yes gene_type:complete